MSFDNELIDNYLDDSLSEEDALRLENWLKADEANLREFVTAIARDEQLRRAVNTKELLENAATHQVSQASTPKRPSISILKWMIAASLIITVSWFVLPRENSASIVTFEGANGPVSLQTEEGFQSGLQSGQTFTTGTLQIGGDGTRANFSYSDGSTVLAAGGTQLKFASNNGKQLVLERGTLAANVSPQAKRQPLTLLTPTAEAVTQGTSLIIDAHETDTLLRVNKGTVRIRRLADNKTLLVAQNQEVHAEEVAEQPLVAEKIKPLPTTWKASPDAKKNIRWKGEWSANGILKAQEQKIYRKELGVHEAHYHAGAKNEFPGLVTLNEQSAIRIRYRIKRPINIGVFISTRSATWNFTGNFQAYIEEIKTPADAEGWRTATVPIKAFYPLNKETQPFQSGCVAATIFATTYADDVGLEVSNLEVVSQ